LAEDVRKAFQREIEKSEGREKRDPKVDAEVCPDWFHPGQVRLWWTGTKIILVLAGRQSGKTLSGPHWLRREIQRTAVCDPGPDEPPNDYIVAGPTLSILANKALPEFLKLFPDDGVYGRYDKAKNKYHLLPFGSRDLLGFVTELTVHFGYAANPESLAAMTAKAAWLDEAGQVQFKRDSYEEIVSRLIISGGRMLITTTAYVSTGWLRELYERGKAGDTEIGLVNFKTSDLGLILWKKGNRAIMQTVRAARKRLPGWKFLMWYGGEFTRPPGAIYDCFEGDVDKVAKHTVDRFLIPDDWRLFWGMDFGPVHTCVLMFAEDPKDKKLFCYASYLPAEVGDGRRTFDQHAEAIKLKSMQCMASRKYREPVAVYGGAKNEDAQRVQYHRRGIKVRPPRFENDVVTQIECTYGAIKAGLVAFFNDLIGPIKEILEYSYKVDEDHDVDETKIQNKEKMHRMDSLRPVVASLFPGKKLETKSTNRFTVPKRAAMTVRV
jgi:hypothetical protein